MPLKIALNLCLFSSGIPCLYPGTIGIQPISRSIAPAQVDGMQYPYIILPERYVSRRQATGTSGWEREKAADAGILCI